MRKALFTSFAVALGLSLAAISWLLLTEAGLRLAADMAADLSGGTVRVRAVHGRLAGKVRMEGVAIATGRFDLAVRDAELSLDLLAMARGTLRISSLTLTGVVVRIHDPEGPSTGTPGPGGGLPFRVEVDQFAAADILVEGLAGDGPVPAGRIELSAAVDGRAIEVGRFAAFTPYGSIELGGRAGFSPGAPVEADLSWTAVLREGFTVGGRGTVRGTFEAIDVALTVTEPFRAALNGLLERGGSGIGWRADAKIDSLEPGAFPGAPSTGMVSGSLEARGTETGFTAGGSLTVTGAPGVGDREVELSFAVSGGPTVLELTALTAQIPGTGSKVTAHGLVRPSGPDRGGELKLAWENLSWPVDGPGRSFRAPAGTAIVQFARSGMSAQVEGTLGGFGQDPFPLFVSLGGDRGHVRMEKLEAVVLGASVEAAGDLWPGPAGRWSASMTARSLDTGFLDERVAGNIDLDLEASGTFEEGSRSFRAKIPTLTGEVRGQAISGSGTISGNGEERLLAEVDLEWGTASFSASGGLDGSWTGRWELHASDLSSFMESGAGSLLSRGTLTGERPLPVVEGTLSGKGLRAGGSAAGSVDGRVRLSLGPDPAVFLSAVVEDVVVAGRSVGNLELEGEGWTGQRRLEARVDGVDISGETLLAGKVDGGKWLGSLTLNALGGRTLLEGEVSRENGLSWRGTIDSRGLHPAAAWPFAPEGLDLAASLSGSLHDGIVRGEADLFRLTGVYRGRSFEGSGLAALSDRQVRIQRFSLASGGARFEASGTVSGTVEAGWELTVPDLSELLSESVGTIAARGVLAGPKSRLRSELSVEGTSLGYRGLGTEFLEFSLSSELTGDGSHAFRSRAGPVEAGGRRLGLFTAEAAGNAGEHSAGLTAPGLPGGGLTLEIHGKAAEDRWTGSIKAGLLGGAVLVDGQVGWREGLQWQARAVGRDLDPGSIDPPWSGAIGFTADLSGTRIAGRSEGSVVIGQVDGLAGGSTLDGSGSVRWDKGNVEVEIPQLKLGNASLSAVFRRGLELAGSWRVDVPDLGVLRPGAKGVFLSQGTLAGTAERPGITGSATGRSLEAGQWRVGNMEVKATREPEGNGGGLFQAKISGISKGGRPLGEGEATLKGLPGDHRLDLHLAIPGADVNSSFTGEWKDGYWQGELVSADLAKDETGRLSLEAPVHLYLSRAEGTVPAACLSGGDGRICFQGGWSGSVAEGSVTLTSLPLELLLPEGMLPFNAEGLLEGALTVRALEGRLAGEARFNLPSGSLLYPTGPGSWGVLRMEELGISALLGKRGGNVSFVTRIGEGRGDMVSMSVELPSLVLPFPEGTLADQPVTGKLKALISDPAFIQAFVPELSEAGGTLGADLLLGGTVASPDLVGEVSFREGKAKVPLLGLNLDSMEGRLTAGGRGQVEVEASVASGKGTLGLKGQVSAGKDRKFSSDWTVKGNALTVSRVPQLFLVLSPDLEVNTEGRVIRLSGTVRVPEAVMRPREVLVDQRPSRDVTVVDRSGGSQDAGTGSVYADVNVILHDKVSFEGFGLSGKLEGSLRVVEAPGKVTTGTGELNILDGAYRAYGQKLVVERGRLIFSGGPVDNPGLDIRAIRQTEEVIAGICVQGTLLAPDVVLFSEPPMDQADVLSYIVLGKPLRRTSGGEGEVLASAALSMGLTRGEPLVQRLGTSLGLDEVTVQTGSDVEQSSLVLGRNLSPRIYVRYGVGVFHSFSVFQFGYRITDRLLLQGESGAQNSTDLLYTIEK